MVVSFLAVLTVSAAVVMPPRTTYDTMSSNVMPIAASMTSAPAVVDHLSYIAVNSADRDTPLGNVNWKYMSWLVG